MSKQEINEINEILSDNGITPARNPFNGWPMVWLSSKFMAVEVTSEACLEKAKLFLGKVFQNISFQQMRNGNFLVQARDVRENVKAHLSH